MKLPKLFSALANTAVQCPEKIAVIADKDEWRYRQLWDLVNKTNKELARFSLPSNAPIAVTAYKTVPTLALMLALGLRDLIGGEVFLHWYNEVNIDGTWLQVSPVFNKLLCQLYGFEPLEFDGYTNAISQPYSDKRVMNYLDTPETFTTPGFSQIINLVNTYHSKMVTEAGRVPRILKERDLA
ncbi:hypothetical protein L2755_05950 [Shewanella abyssi]|uniref:hypothetical protein n=1 Tax=Shewanella abyssi TaxID=311789 RepID=UPI00200E23B8|nr:hypothetical protein [Shewanella abyssi]MCL1049166.1 hypothetical protein [Shewanella abyssi]